MVKKNIYVFLFFLLFYILAGCQKPSTTNKVKTFRLAYVMSPNGVVHKGAEKFTEIVSAKTKGNVRVKLYPGGQLGNGRVLTEGLRLGSIDGVITGPAIVGWYAPSYGAIEAPFVFRDYAHLNKVMNGDVGDEIKQRLKDRQQISMLSYWHRGPRYLTTSNAMVRTPKDLEGMKLRVPELPTYIKSWQIFGANTTPLPYSDMFMALKLGVVEGQENPLEVIFSENLHEVQNYVIETKHLISFYIFSVGKRFKSKFSPSTQKVIIEASEIAREYQNQLVQDYEKKYKNMLKKRGMEFIKPNREAFRNLALTEFSEAFGEIWADDLYKRIRSIK